MINIEGFYITSPGDPSVGIFSSYWELINGFCFENEEELEEFRKNLKEAFEMIADDCYVETFEERKKLLEQEDELWKGQQP